MLQGRESLLEALYKRNYKTPSVVQLPMASVDRAGQPMLQMIHFAQFLQSDPRIVLFSASIQNARLMSAVKSSSDHEILWTMPSGDSLTIH